MKEISPADIRVNPFKLFGSDWTLITAGTKKSCNTMTASWGGFGVLWDKNVCFCFVRPVRHTYQFLEKNDRFSLSFFDEKYRSALNYCGSNSGRDTDKIAGSGLTPVEEFGTVYFKEARLVVICEKIYFEDFDPKNFRDPKIAAFYPLKDYHRMYLGGIVTCLAG
ncbi:MAG TPA: flavin reductase [Elusimicrobiota bacterium]|nr:flavin reductase [Elusimicrobiota bacterium]